METQHAKQIIKNIEARNRWFKASVVLFMALILAGLLLSIYLILQNQHQIGQAINQLQAQTEENRKQGMTNQQYIRCIILIPRENYNNRDDLVKALDNCARQSVLPPLNPPTNSSTQSTKGSNQQVSTNPSAPRPATVTKPAPSAATTPPPDGQPPSNPPPAPQPSLLDRAKNVLTGLLN